MSQTSHHTRKKYGCRGKGNPSYLSANSSEVFVAVMRQQVLCSNREDLKESKCDSTLSIHSQTFHTQINWPLVSDTVTMSKRVEDALILFLFVMMTKCDRECSISKLKFEENHLYARWDSIIWTESHLCGNYFLKTVDFRQIMKWIMPMIFVIIRKLTNFIMCHLHLISMFWVLELYCVIQVGNCNAGIQRPQRQNAQHVWSSLYYCYSSVHNHQTGADTGGMKPHAGPTRGGSSRNTVPEPDNYGGGRDWRDIWVFITKKLGIT